MLILRFVTFLFVLAALIILPPVGLCLLFGWFFISLLLAKPPAIQVTVVPPANSSDGPLPH